MKITTSIDYDTPQLLNFMLPGLRLAEKIIQEQIKQIEGLSGGNQKLPEPKKQTNQRKNLYACNKCHLLFKGQGFANHAKHCKGVTK